MYFLALVCPSALNNEVFRFKTWMKDQLGCVVALKSPAHITLIPPFWMDESKETELVQVLGTFKSDISEIEVQTAGFDHFGKRVLFIAIEKNNGLEQLRSKLEDHLLKYFLFIKKDTRPFHPHITIANRDMKPSHFEKAWEYFGKKEFKETFTGRATSLLKLVHGKWIVIYEKSW